MRWGQAKRIRRTSYRTQRGAIGLGVAIGSTGEVGGSDPDPSREPPPAPQQPGPSKGKPSSWICSECVDVGRAPSRPPYSGHRGVLPNRSCCDNPGMALAPSSFSGGSRASGPAAAGSTNPGSGRRSGPHLDGVVRASPVRGVRADRRQRRRRLDAVAIAGVRRVRWRRPSGDRRGGRRAGLLRGVDPVRVPRSRAGVCHGRRGSRSAVGVRVGEAGCVCAARDVVGVAADDPGVASWCAPGCRCPVRLRCWRCC